MLMGEVWNQTSLCTELKVAVEWECPTEQHTSLGHNYTRNGMFGTFKVTDYSWVCVKIKFPSLYLTWQPQYFFASAKLLDYEL